MNEKYKTIVIRVVCVLGLIWCAFQLLGVWRTFSETSDPANACAQFGFDKVGYTGQMTAVFDPIKTTLNLKHTYNCVRIGYGGTAYAGHVVFQDPLAFISKDGEYAQLEGNPRYECGNGDCVTRASQPNRIKCYTTGDEEACNKIEHTLEALWSGMSGYTYGAD